MKATRRSTAVGTLVLQLTAIGALAIALAGCSTTSKTAEVSASATEPPATSAAAKDTDKAAAESEALRIIKDASAYQESMNARIVSDPAERLDSTRSPGLTVIVRIDRDGRPVDLSYKRFTGGFNTIVFGAKDDIPVRGYDHRILTDGNAVLALVDELAQTPSQSR